MNLGVDQFQLDQHRKLDANVPASEQEQESESAAHAVSLAVEQAPARFAWPTLSVVALESSRPDARQFFTSAVRTRLFARGVRFRSDSARAGVRRRSARHAWLGQPGELDRVLGASEARPHCRGRALEVATAARSPSELLPRRASLRADVLLLHRDGRAHEIVDGLGWVDDESIVVAGGSGEGFWGTNSGRPVRDVNLIASEFFYDEYRALAPDDDAYLLIIQPANANWIRWRARIEDGMVSGDDTITGEPTSLGVSSLARSLPNSNNTYSLEPGRLG